MAIIAQAVLTIVEHDNGVIEAFVNATPSVEEDAEALPTAHSIAYLLYGDLKKLVTPVETENETSTDGA